MRDFRKALLWTAIPLVIVGISSAGAVMAGVQVGLLGGVTTALWFLAILACIGFAIAHKRQIATGILAGAGIGLVGLGLTCFAAVSVIGGW